MVKNISIFLLGLITFALFLIAFKSCDKKIGKVEQTSNESLNLNAIQKRITDSINLHCDSLIRKYRISDSITKTKARSLTLERNRLLAIVRGFKNVRIDSVNQTVNDIPIAVYEAEMNANAICDTLLNFKDVQISIRDSVIFLREQELKSCENMNKANEQALKDLIALEGQEKRKLKRAKGLNKKIPLIAGITAGITFVLVTLALK